MRLQLLAATVAATLPVMAGDSSPASTVSVWLPGWDSASWKNLQGTIVTTIGEDTSFSIFCEAQTVEECIMIGPVTFTEGPKSLHYHYDDSTVSVDIECALEGTSAATCTGSTSRSLTTSGLAESVISSTVYTGSGLQWVPLVLTTPPETTATLDVTATPITDSNGNTIDPTDASGATPEVIVPPEPNSANGEHQALWTVALFFSFASGIGLVL